jgi:hypothetical protein
LPYIANLRHQAFQYPRLYAGIVVDRPSHLAVRHDFGFRIRNVIELER